MVIKHHDSNGLCYQVGHEDGTVGFYDPSELEILMQKYILSAEARWTSSCEYQGGKRDIHTPESRKLFVEFGSPYLGTARIEAKRLLAVFESELPKKREGGLSWQDKDAEIVSVTFARILPL